MAQAKAMNFVDGEWMAETATNPVYHKYSGEVIATAYVADESLVKRAIASAHHAAARPCLSPCQRYEALSKLAEKLYKERKAIVQDMVGETGFTLKDCNGELNRAFQTVINSAEEAKRIGGDMVPIQGAPGFEEHLCFTRRVPVGVVCAITPFNSPINTLLHKVAPALAAGNTVVLKPSLYTPLSANRICQLIVESGFPPDSINLVLGSGSSIGELLVRDSRIAFYTFTGSTRVGREISSKIGLRRSNMECGSISCTVVCEDANVRRAAQRICRASFRKAGQVCTSVQRLYVHEDVAEPLCSLLTAEIDELVCGDPEHPDTDVGPMISETEAVRAKEWIDEANNGGANLIRGGQRRGSLLAPTLLRNVPEDSKVISEEVFAPVVCLIEYRDFDDVIDRMNQSPYGLQSGVFTSDMSKALRAARKLKVGGVVINDTSSTRADLMPYGGIKDSGHGKEGPRHSVREMTDERLVMIAPYD